MYKFELAFPATAAGAIPDSLAEQSRGIVLNERGWSRTAGVGEANRAQDKESDRVESKGNEARRHGDGIIFLVASKVG